MEHSRNGVPPNYFDRAGEIIDKGAADEEEVQRVMELPAEDDVVTAPDPDHDDWDPDNWNPEEATWMIEASLRENNINARRDPLEDGSRKFSSCLTMKGARAKSCMRSRRPQ